MQRTLPLGIVLNIGYNGSKGTRLDIVDAPGRTANASVSGVFYDYEDSVAFSNYNALTVSVRNRLHDGIALEATYTYSHSIDNASSIGGNGGNGYGGGAKLAGSAGGRVQFQLRRTQQGQLATFSMNYRSVPMHTTSPPGGWGIR